MIDFNTEIPHPTDTGCKYLQCRRKSDELTALLTLCYTFLAIGMAVNGVLLFVFARSKRLRYLPSNKLVCSLLMSDLLIEIGFAVTISMHAESLAHKMAYVLKVFAMAVTVLTLCMIWIDRLITLKLSFSYRRIFDSKTVAKILIALWSTGFVLAVASLILFSGRVEKIAYTTWRYLLSVLTVIGFLVLATANVSIYNVARSQVNKIKRNSSRRARNYHTWQLKSTYLCTAMVATFLVFWLPYLIENIELLTNRQHDAYFLQDWFQLFGALMIICNTVAHPCLYVLLNRNVRTLIVRRWRNSLKRLALKRTLESQRYQSSCVTLSMKTI